MKSSTPRVGFLTVLIAGSAFMFAAQEQKPAPSKPQTPSQQPAPPQPAEDIPVTNAESGPCSIELTVTDSDAKPVLAALINFRAAYGLFGAHKLDMSVYTNAQGKARFTGIPVRVKNPPIEFRAFKGDLAGIATMNPATECQAQHDIMMAKKSSH